MKLVIAGKGGQGVKFLGTLLGKILMRDYNVVVFFDYDAASRGGDIIGYIIYDKDQIGNMTVDEADVFLKFADVKKDIKSKEVIDGSKFIGDHAINMVGLGYLLKYLNIEISETELKELIKKKVDENINAIKYGISLR